MHRNKRTIGTTFERDTHTSPLLRDRLDVRQSDIPFASQSLGAHEHDPVIGQHDQYISTRKLQMRNVVLVEIFAIIGRLEPELTQGFALGIGPYNALCSDETGQTDTIQTFSIEYSCRVSNTLSKIYYKLASNVQHAYFLMSHT